MATAYFRCVLCLCVCACAYSQEYLYYSTPGQTIVEQKSGIYGGPVSFHYKGEAQDLKRSGFYCSAMPNNGFRRQLDIRSMAYDPISNDVILQLDEISYGRVSALKGPLCTNTPKCQESGTKVFFAVAENTDKPQKAKLGPFAMWNSSVFFVVSRFTEGDNRRVRTHHMELRRLAGCDYPFTVRLPMDLDSCSEYVATFAEETDTNVVLEMRETIKPAYHLHVTERKDGQLVFMLQIFKYGLDEERTMQNYSMILLSVMAGRPAKKLYEVFLPEIYSWYTMKELGAIDYRTGALCWTATNQIICADWDLEGPLTNIRRILKPGQSRRVCEYISQPNSIYENITTGVAIADTQNGISLYFGCYSGEENNGGAGLLREKYGKVFIYPLADRKSKIYAGSMFLTSSCPIPEDLVAKLTAEAHAQSLHPRWPLIVLLPVLCGVLVNILR